MFGFTHELTTIITHHNSVHEWSAWKEGLPNEAFSHIREWEETDPFQHMMEAHLNGFRDTVVIFHHDSVEEMEAFASRYGVELMSQRRAVEAQGGMFANEEKREEARRKDARRVLYLEQQNIINEQIRAFHEAVQARIQAGEDVPVEERYIEILNPYREPTIAEELGIDLDDITFGDMSDEEAEKKRKIMEAARANGTMLADSWGGGNLTGNRSGNLPTGEETGTTKDERLRAVHGTVYTREGNIVSATATYRKTGGQVDEVEKARREAEREEHARTASDRMMALSPEELEKAFGNTRWDSLGSGQIVMPDEDEDEEVKAPIRRTQMGKPGAPEESTDA